ncbi:DNA polymerase III subunit [Rufibacter tibetensis]|uniref:DNA polymerase III subunit delta n=1 Tax=Rufibacter tibetensis TaxID=512763 RepID=A0A0P0CD57_9BACT|nr:DNA polymerase III subunit delta [Rufibacter tibetensis]ALI99694.1 DNA polymerase III subunit delta [Rufibacter tibetensis]
MQFSQIYGHQGTKQLLLNSVKSQHVAHAQLFLGSDGSANMALALAYAQYLNCEDPQPLDSCGVCPSCNKISKRIHPDLNFVMPVTKVKDQDALSKNFVTQWRAFLSDSPYQTLNDWMQFIGAENKQGTIPVGESRELVRMTSLKAFEAKYKVIVIWLPELMNASAANAFLKLLEEPPAATVFLLVSNASDKIMPTILSRTQLVKVRAFTDEEVIQYLVEQQGTERERAYQVVSLAEGNLQAARVLSQEMTSDYFTFFLSWMRLCYNHKFDGVLEQSEDFQKLGRENQKNFLQFALGLLRKVLLYGVDSKLIAFLPPPELDFVQKFAKLIHQGNGAQLSQELNDAHYHIERNAHPKITFLNTSIQIAQLIRPVA